MLKKGNQGSFIVTLILWCIQRLLANLLNLPSHSPSLNVFPTSLLFCFLTSLHRLASLSPRPCCLATLAEPPAATVTNIHSDPGKNRTESKEIIIWNGSESTRLLPRHMTAGLMGSCSARSLRSTRRPPDHIFVWFRQRWYVPSANRFLGRQEVYSGSLKSPYPDSRPPIASEINSLQTLGGLETGPG